MAVIQKIRDKYAKLAGGVIVLALVGFVLMDSTAGGRGGLFGRSTTIGKINGKKIDYQDYENRITAYQNQLKQQNPNMNFDEATQSQIRDQVWNQMISETLMEDINNKLGLNVSEAEMKELMLGPNPHAMIRQAFGNMSAAEIGQQITAAERSSDPRNKAALEQFKQQLAEVRQNEKFTALVNGAIYTPKYILDAQYNEANNIANIDYVTVPYAAIPDAQVKVTDEDINTYIKNHSKLFTAKNQTRGIEFVKVEVKPSAEDAAKVQAAIAGIKEGFITTTDNDAYATRNSEVSIPTKFHTEESLKGLPNSAELINAPVGTVVGPFTEGENVMLAKVVEKNNLPDSVRVRHILVNFKQQGQDTRTPEAAKLRIDSVVALIKSGASFDSLVATYSDDPGSKTTGGAYTFQLDQKEGMKELGDFAFSGAKGATNVVKVENNGYSGYHFIEILEKGELKPLTKIAFIGRVLQPSKQTYENVYNKASQFANKINGHAENFDKEALTLGLNKLTASGIDQNSYTIQNLGASSELVNWAYSAKIGEVSPIVNMGGDKFIVAKLTSIQEPGLMKVTPDMKMQFETYLRNQKKAKLILDQYKGKTSLTEIAAASQQQVTSADSVTFVSSNNNGILDPKFTGAIFNKSLKENTLTQGIPSNTGVIYAVVKSKATIPGQPRNLMVEQMMSSARIKGNATQQIMNSLVQNADVKDTRSKVYSK